MGSTIESMIQEALRPALAEAFDEGWHAHYLEFAAQEDDPAHPITKENPYR